MKKVKKHYHMRVIGKTFWQLFFGRNKSIKCLFLIMDHNFTGDKNIKM